MDETSTRRKKIDPKLYEVGWEQVPESEILTEQRAYEIAPGRVQKLKSRHPKKVDYLLVYKGQKLAVIEAKSDEKDVSEGVAQAKEYAQRLQIRYTYSTNGDKIWAIDMGVEDADGNCIGYHEGEVDKFPSPQELWNWYFPIQNEWRDKFRTLPFNRDGGRSVRYYQENAVNNVLDAVANQQKRILLTMATGTGKTYTAFQICWKLFQTKWNLSGDGKRQPRILFIADRNILADQAKNDFSIFPEDAMARITAEEMRIKYKGTVPQSRSLYFTIFQTFMGEDGGVEYYKQLPKEFFDFIIIDECHRGGANDESEWRRLMEYFEPAYQLGMTATPQRRVNANTYKYFGEPVYTYSLKQGIEDGFLTPFRVEISDSNIDDYTFQQGDTVVSGELDKEKTYTETDFYNGKIEIRERDIHRVQEFLSKIEPDEKTIVFCATQKHAEIIRDIINQNSKKPHPFYCVRVTADDGDKGEEQLREFQDNEKRLPTILTTSRKLSTGVDARNVRNIVLLRPVNNMVEFKQIIGRGTRLFSDKFYFTIFDFVGAYKNFNDASWDGEPVCPVCGNWPCTCGKEKPQTSPHEPCPVCGEWPCVCPPKPCPICGNLPCTCEGGSKRKTVEVILSKERTLSLTTNWTEKFQFDDRLIDINEFIQILFGRLPKFFNSDEDLRSQWQNPETRFALLRQLENEGFAEEKLQMVRRVLNLEKCDLLDVLEYLAYNTTPIERQKRVDLVNKYYQKANKAQQDFADYLLQQYVINGALEMSMDNLPKFIKLKYGSPADAKRELGMDIAEIKNQYIELQKQLYTVA